MTIVTNQEVNGKSATLIFLTSDFKPSTPDDADMIKVLFDDGNCMFIKNNLAKPNLATEVKGDMVGDAGFDPNEPRIAKGQAGGGKWTKGGGSSGGENIGGSHGEVSAAHARTSDRGAGGVGRVYSELPQGQGQKFHDAIAAAKASTRYGAAVTLYSTDEYDGMRLFLSPSGLSGFALKDDDIVSVFKHKDDKTPNVLVDLIKEAVDEGGRRLDCFDTMLPVMYANRGFKVVARTPFNPDYKPDGWDYETFHQYNGGQPDVVFMVYDPEHANSEGGEKVSDYDEGVDLQKKVVATSDATKPVKNTAESLKARGFVKLPPSGKGFGFLTGKKS